MCVCGGGGGGGGTNVIGTRGGWREKDWRKRLACSNNNHHNDRYLERLTRTGPMRLHIHTHMPYNTHGNGCEIPSRVHDVARWSL